MRSLYDLSYSELTALVERWEEPSYRVDQVWNGLYNHLYSHAGKFTTLPLELREEIREQYIFHTLSPEREITSPDGLTKKILFRLQDQETIETVLMHYGDRHTLCISSQAGCAMGCDFCATGQMGFRRHLTSGEIVEQVVYFQRQLAERDQRLTNIVFMGMGEPFHNYQEVMAAVDRLMNEKGLNFGARRITISTVGIIPGIKKFARENTQVNLAVSLHAAENKRRSSMLPINNKYPLEDLMEAVGYYIQETNRRVSFEWALIEDVNDTLEEADRLADLLQDMLVHVNLIPLNPTADYSGEPAVEEQAQAFQERLISRGIPSTIRLRRGIEIQAGCGQLASQES